MRVLLLTVPWSYEYLKGKNDLNKTSTKRIELIGILPNLGMLYIASSLKKKGHDISYIDGFFSSKHEILNVIKKKRIEVIGISCVSCMWSRTSYFIRLIKKKFSGVYIVLGGKHASYWKKKCLIECSGLDAVVYGEGEETFLDLIDNFGKKSYIKGAIIRKNDVIVANGPRELANPNKIPFPLFELVNFSDYEPNIGFYFKKPFMHIISSRGCVLDCNFCSSKLRLRSRDHSNIFAEMELLNKRYNIKTVNFYGDYNLFTEDEECAKRLCNYIIKRGLIINWTTYLGSFKISNKLLQLMRMAGCLRVHCPIESGLQKNRDAIKSDHTAIRDIEKCIYKIKKNNIETYARFMVGIPGETNRDIIKTLKFAKNIMPDYVSFAKVFLFSHAQYEYLLKEGCISKNLREWSLFNSNFYKSESVSNFKLKLIILYCYISFYSNPIYIIKKIIKIKRYPLLLRYFKRIILK